MDVVFMQAVLAGLYCSLCYFLEFMQAVLAGLYCSLC